MSPWLENLLLETCEAAMAAIPRGAPTLAQLDQAVIVAHRGERDGHRVKENTLAAFDPVVAAGVGAIEFDIRYTRDDEPVVHHDADLSRVFGHAHAIAELDFSELRRLEPRVPHLDELLSRYAGHTRLMIELKTRGSSRAEQRLHQALAPLTPTRDFYFLSLDTERLQACRDYPPACRIVVAKTNWRHMQAWTAEHACGGIAGPYLFITRDDIQGYRAAGDFIGSGFLTRRGLLMREIGRDVPWIFTNRPLKLQALLDRARTRARATD